MTTFTQTAAQAVKALVAMSITVAGLVTVWNTITWLTSRFSIVEMLVP